MRKRKQRKNRSKRNRVRVVIIVILLSLIREFEVRSVSTTYSAAMLLFLLTFV